VTKTIQDGLWQEELGVSSLKGSQCPQCESKYFPERKVCPKCYWDKLSTVLLSGSGIVFSCTQVFIRSKLISEHPYTVGYVLLEDGITVPARLMGDKDKLDIGLPVSLAVGVTGKNSEGEEVIGYYFQPPEEVEA